MRRGGHRFGPLSPRQRCLHPCFVDTAVCCRGLLVAVDARLDRTALTPVARDLDAGMVLIPLWYLAVVAIGGRRQGCGLVEGVCQIKLARFLFLTSSGLHPHVKGTNYLDLELNVL